MLKAINTIVVSTISLILCCSPAEEASERWWTNADRTYVLSELNRTTNEIRAEIDSLSLDQWNFKEEPERWSIAEIIEHLEMQNQLHYRELSVTSLSPRHVKYRKITEGNDAYFVKYATDTIKGQASWYLEPKGKYKTEEACKKAFYKARGEITSFVEKTDIDLRKQFTFRVPVEGKAISQIKIGQVRDLHQLILTGIAHTDRHLTQIRRIKTHPNYPTE